MITKIAFLQDFPPTDKMFEKTFYIQIDTLTGSCFSFNHENQEYIITARHLFPKNIKNKAKVDISILLGRVLKKVTAQILLHKNTNVDVAVLRIPYRISNEMNYPPGSPIIGQNVYFLGYPTLKGRLLMTDDKISNFFPLVKKAIISGFVKIDSSSIVLLDGQNTSGFSGGPVYFYNYFEKKYMISSIVTGYYLQENEITIGKGKAIKFDENSGIIICFDINNALEIIKENIK